MCGGACDRGPIHIYGNFHAVTPCVCGVACTQHALSHESTCDFNYVCKLLARTAADDMSTSGYIAKPAGHLNKGFCMSLALDQRTPIFMQSTTT